MSNIQKRTTVVWEVKVPITEALTQQLSKTSLKEWLIDFAEEQIAEFASGFYEEEVDETIVVAAEGHFLVKFTLPAQVENMEDKAPAQAEDPDEDVHHVPWRMIPENIMWVAQDQNGVWHGFCDQPEWADASRTWESGYRVLLNRSCNMPRVVYPEDSLFKRIEIQWAKIPAKFIWAAMDAKGFWWAFSTEPRWSVDRRDWVITGEGRTLLIEGAVDTPPEKSLTRRP